MSVIVGTVTAVGAVAVLMTLAAFSRMPCGSPLSMSWKLCGFSPAATVIALGESTPRPRG